MRPQSRFIPAALTPALAILVLILPVLPVQASLYELDLRRYDGGNLICGSSLDFKSDSTPVTGSATDTMVDVVGNSSGEYEAIAGLGYVGMKQNVSHRVNPGFGRVFGSCSEVRTVIDDLQVVGPPGQITASLNANLLAKIEVDTLSSRSHLRVTVSLRSTQGGPVASNTVDIDSSESRDIDQVINSGPLTFDAGDVLEAELKIEMRLVAGVTPGGVTVINEFDFLDRDRGFRPLFLGDRGSDPAPGLHGELGPWRRGRQRVGRDGARHGEHLGRREEPVPLAQGVAAGLELSSPRNLSGRKDWLGFELTDDAVGA